MASDTTENEDATYDLTFRWRDLDFEKFRKDALEDRQLKDDAGSRGIDGNSGNDGNDDGSR